MTLLSNLQDILDLAKWADWLILKWRELVTPIVSGLIELFGIRVSVVATSMIAMALFVSFIALGSRIENEFKKPAAEAWPIRWTNIFNARVLLGTMLYLLQGVLISLPAFVPAAADLYLRFPYTFIAVCYVLYCGAIIIGLRGWPIWTSIVVAASMIGFSFVFGYSAHEISPPNVSETASTVIAALCAIACGLMVVGIAPPLAFTKRVIFMVIGVTSVIALSQLSQWGITATP
ncbi:hypothetical protein [Phyllobacterium salinisoli]|uniref:hypothetical protein n=1 Tax=Phyllobacterium salinisoli TaxID=1899321 RepID=UPI001FDF5266|nr:hypothetical protein [Phyllobacterium salinisoli]